MATLKEEEMKNPVIKEVLEPPKTIGDLIHEQVVIPPTAPTVKPEQPVLLFDIKRTRPITDMDAAFGPSKVPPICPVPSTSDTFFTEMNITSHVELDEGEHFIIDVQSDLRFLFATFIATTTKEYPKLEVKEFPAVTPASYVAYKMVLFHTIYLLNDIHNRITPSPEAQLWRNDTERKDLLAKILACKVPPDVGLLLESISMAQDPKHPRLRYVPTFAAASFDHDYGRLIPPAICIVAHNALANYQINSKPTLMRRSVYHSHIMTYANHFVRIGNILGKYGSDQTNAPVTHNNWINRRFDTIFAPNVMRSLLQRPTVLNIPYEAPIYTEQNFNVYDYLLGYSTENFVNIKDFLTAFTEFITFHNLSTKTLSDYFDLEPNVNILTHSIERVTLPTWHVLDIPAPGVDEPLLLTDSAYAELVNFMVPVNDGAEDMLPPDGVINPDLYLVGPEPYDPIHPVTSFESFSKAFVHPDVLWFQPLSKDPDAIASALALGIKIEQESLDGVSIPLPNPEDVLTVTNSQYLQGSLPLALITRLKPSRVIENAFIITKRHLHTQKNRPMSIILRDMTQNVVPRFCRNACREAFHHIFRGNITNNCTNVYRSFTYVGWKYGEIPPIPGNIVYFWSSFRNVRNERGKPKLISMYYTLRGQFGLSPCLSRSPNPTLLFPY